MSKFNNTTARARTGNSFIKSEDTPSVLTHEGAHGYLRDEKSELFLAVVSDFAGEGSFYESASNRTNRINSLVRKVAVSDPAWFGDLVKWLRNDANMRSISLVIALEGAKALIDAGISGGRKLVSDAISRADEPGEALAYWMSQHGRKIPSAVKRGIADGAVKTFNEFSLGKYDTSSKGYRFADVIRLTHPTPKDAVQSDLFKFAMDRRNDSSATAPESLKMAENRKRILSLPREEIRSLITSDNGTDELKSAGLTWEAVAGSTGLDAEIYESLIPTMGYMALLRNLRNFEEKGVSNEVLDKVADRISDPEQVARSRQLPFRFLSAHRAVSGYQTDPWGRQVRSGIGSLRFAYPLEKALNASLENVPALKGNTLILVDRSGSMFQHISQNTQLTFADTAAVFGTALALRAENSTLVQFGTDSEKVSFKKSSSLLKLVDSFRGMGGTSTALAVQKHFNKSFDRVIIITDEQASRYWGGNPTEQVPTNIPVYTWNLKGYQASHGASGANRHYFGGLSDQSFKLIPFIEAGTDANWPWED